MKTDESTPQALNGPGSVARSWTTDMVDHTTPCVRHLARTFGLQTYIWQGDACLRRAGLEPRTANLTAAFAADTTLREYPAAVIAR